MRATGYSTTWGSTNIRAGTLRIVLDPETGEEALLPYVGTLGIGQISGHVWLERRGIPIDFASRHYPPTRTGPTFGCRRNASGAAHTGNGHGSRPTSVPAPIRAVRATR